VLDRVQKKAAQFTNHAKCSDWENLVQPKTIARLCALFKAYYGERAWKATGCEGLTIWIWLTMLGKLATNNKEGISGLFLCK